MNLFDFTHVHECTQNKSDKQGYLVTGRQKEGPTD